MGSDSSEKISGIYHAETRDLPLHAPCRNCTETLIKHILLGPDDLFAKLDIHVASLPKVSIIRLNKARGLMVARQVGIERSRSDYFVVMDSHMEVNTGWLEPLIHRLIERPKALLTSKIGSINSETMSVHHSPGSHRTSMIGFNFNMAQLWMNYEQAYLDKHPNITEPLETPAVQGMFIAMRKDFFLQLGGFDTGMEIWGAEQMELSIKVWLCGGCVEKVPCSLVAHLFRHTPWSGNASLVTKNRLRVGAVWLDEYKDAMFHTQKHRMVDYGDVDDRIKIRETKNCKPFQYFVDRVHDFNSAIYYPLNPIARGRIRSLTKNSCISAGNKPFKTPKVSHCSYSENQYFILTEMSDIRFKSNLCLVPDKNDTNTGNREVRLTDCSGVKDGRYLLWAFQNDMTLRNSEHCLTADVQQNKLILQECQDLNSQRWIWEW